MQIYFLLFTSHRQVKVYALSLKISLVDINIMLNYKTMYKE